MTAVLPEFLEVAYRGFSPKLNPKYGNQNQSTLRIGKAFERVGEEFEEIR